MHFAVGTGIVHFAGIARPLRQQFMAPSRLLETAASRLKTEKKEEDNVIKSEPNPSPTKRLASEFEKKIKSMSGDTTLIKDDDGSHSQLQVHVLVII